MKPYALKRIAVWQEVRGVCVRSHFLPSWTIPDPNFVSAANVLWWMRIHQAASVSAAQGAVQCCFCHRNTASFLLLSTTTSLERWRYSWASWDELSVGGSTPSHALGLQGLCVQWTTEDLTWQHPHPGISEDVETGLEDTVTQETGKPLILPANNGGHDLVHNGHRVMWHPDMPISAVEWWGGQVFIW